MNQSEFEAYVADMPNVQREENFGYSFYFVGDDHRLPFVTFANSDNDYDSVSNLSREGVFRINIGVGKESFKTLISDAGGELDYSVLDVFLPHPDYAKLNWICILSPTGDNVESVRRLILEAHAIAAERPGAATAE